MENNEKCLDCNNTGRVKGKDGSYHCCFKCLTEGRLNQHDKNMRDPKIRL